MAKGEKVRLGTVIVYGNPNYRYDGEKQEWSKTEDDKTPTCDIQDIQEIDRDRIITSKYVLPLADATITNGDDGLVYSYNCSLPYLTETAHLAEVEKNIIVGQAFLYAGRNLPNNKPSMLVWVLVAAMILLALVGMFQ